MPVLPVPVEQLRPIGYRVVCKLVHPTEVVTPAGLFIPSNRKTNHNKLGKVLAVGNGVWFGKTRPMPVKVGDTCFFQLETNQATNTVYISREHGEVFFLHGDDMIGTLKKPVFDLDNFQVVGTWILVKVGLRSQIKDSKIVLPSTEDTTHEFQTYTVVQVGAGVSLPIQVGDELSLARSRCNPIYLSGELFGWIEEKFVYGAMTGLR